MKRDEKRIMSLAEKYLDIAVKLQKELADPELNSIVADMVVNAKIGYRQTYEAVSNKKDNGGFKFQVKHMNQ